MNAPEVQAEPLARELLEQAPVCQWAIDSNLIFRAVFGCSAALFGATPGQLKGAVVPAAFGAARIAEWKDRVARVLAGESLDFRTAPSSGHTFRVFLFPIRDAAGAVVLAGGIALDATAVSVAEEELRQMVLSALHAQELERNRFSRFLHDDVGQCLSAAGLQLDLLRMDLETQVPGIGSRTAEIQEQLERLMSRVRDYSNELNPATVERTGIAPALDRLVGRVRRSFQGTVRLMADSSVRVRPETALALFKIAQEGVENAVQHSRGTHIEVQWKSSPAGPALEIHDNGGGFDYTEVARSRRGLGLLIMQHYATETGLELSIVSEPERGTMVRAICPPAAKGR